MSTAEILDITDNRVAAATFLDMLFGDTEGWAAVVFGTGGYFDGNGKYSFPRDENDWRKNGWQERKYAWPAEREKLLSQTLAHRGDVYICPALRAVRSRKENTAGPARWAWVDLDRPWDDEAAELCNLPGIAVIGSGRGSHIYAKLPTVVDDPLELDEWNRRLGAYVGEGADAKWKDNSVLRLPGTFSYKSAARGGEPTPIVWRQVPVDGDLPLDLLLPPDPQPEAKTATKNSTGYQPTATDLAEIDQQKTPKHIEGYLSETVTEGMDRSERLYALVCAAYEWGYSNGAIHEFARRHAPSVDKYGPRLAGNVDAIISKQAAGDRGKKRRELAEERQREDKRYTEEIIQQGRRQQAPKDEPATETDADNGDGQDDGNDPPTTKISRGRPCTDIGNAERLIDHHGDDMLYFAPAKEWLIWDGKRWAADRTLKHRTLAKKVVRTIYDEAAAATDSEQRKSLAKWAVNSESAGRVSAMVTLAESDVAVTEEDLDKDVWLVNTQNGTLNLRTGQLEPHDRGDRLTKITKVAYNPNAQCPRWMQFLDEIMQGDQELIDYLQRAVGYTLTGDDSEQCFLVLYGVGANGKGTFVNTLAAILGDYAGTCGRDVIAGGIRKSQGAANEELVDLRGQRLVTATETEQGEPLAEAMVKRITGGDPITARKLFGHNITFNATFTLWLSTNHLPKISGTDDGIWRRLKLVPFNAKFPEGRNDPHLKEKLIEEAEGILAWAVEGVRLWQAHGLTTPESVRSATHDYRAESDHVQQFIDDECDVSTEMKELQKTVFARYVKWCEDETQTPLSSLEFKRTLERKGLTVKRVSHNGSFGNCFLGLRIRSSLS